MRIVIIDPSCFSMPYDHSLCEALAKQECQVLFIGSQSPYDQWKHPTSYKRWDHFYRLTNCIYKKKHLGLGRKYMKGVEHLFDMERLVHRLRKWSPDVIHFEWLPLPPIDRWFLPSLRKIAPLVLTVHDTQPFHGSPSSKVQLLGLYNALHKFDHYIVHTKFSRSELSRNMKVPTSRISVIPHGVFDYYKTIQIKPQEHSAAKTVDSKKTVLFFGLIKPYKGLDLLIKAFARLPERLQKESQLLVAGYPKMPIEPLQKLATQLGIAKHIVWDLRFIPEEEVASIFERASIVALPYYRIDQSGVLMTALAFGKPIIASKIGGFAEVLKDNIYGYLVEPGDVDDLAKALERILSHPELAQQMGKAVEELARGELSWDSIAKRTMEVYQSLRRG